jgi:hypothetical protein
MSLAIDNSNFFIPKRREGTRNFMDVSLENRISEFNSVHGLFLEKILPPEVLQDLRKVILSDGIESEAAFRVRQYFLSGDNENPVSQITRWVDNNPYNPRVFRMLYGEQDIISPLDKFFILTSGAHAIYLRLQSVIDHLPEVITQERKRLGLKENEKYIIYNVGAAYGLDTVYMMAENPWLRNLVQIVHIDPDGESLYCGQCYAEKLGVDCIEFVPKKIEEASLGKAHMLLFIGMFCPMSTRRCILTLGFIKNFLVENGIAIFSTVQEKMLDEGAILDFIMWMAGWRMYFKTDNEPGKIAQMAGLRHEKAMDWEDDLGYNRMTVARVPGRSIFRKISNVINVARAYMFL